jgi:NAD(P)-dependent dehydrogenase (short-subunit alcohol dehydrogenase family)
VIDGEHVYGVTPGANRHRLAVGPASQTSCWDFQSRVRFVDNPAIVACMTDIASIADLFRLDGRVALVTGAGGAFGRAIAVGFSQMGARVFLTDLHAEHLAETADVVRAAGGTCAGMVGDTGSTTDVHAVFDHLDAAFGQIDVLVNNAGGNPMQGRPEEFPLEIWESVLRTNLTGYFLNARAAGKRMIAQGHGGSIVNVSSIAAASSLGRGNLAYGASKSGVNQLTRELAVEWAHHGIRVNAIQPCQFLNAGWRGMIADPSKSSLVQRVLSGIPIGRMGEPREIVGPVLFLVSDAASMVTGVLLPVDGGNLALNPTGSLPIPD